MTAKRPLVTDNMIKLFPENREFQRFLMDLGGIQTDKASKVTGGTEDNIVTLDSTGDIQDGGQSLTDLESRAFFFARIY